MTARTARTARERASKIFERAIYAGTATLTPEELELYAVQTFVVEFECGGLSGYLYNTLPDLDSVDTAIAAMRNHGLDAAARVLEEAASLFRTYVDPDPPSTWGAVLNRYDPQGKLSKLQVTMSEVLDW